MTTQQNIDQAQDFARFVDLQQKHTETSNKLEALEASINDSSQRAITSSTEAYVVLQEALTALDAQLKLLFERHPEWRRDNEKSVTTPFGVVQQRTVTELEVANPAATVALIEARGRMDQTFKAEDFLHVEKKPDLEALERLGNDDLSALGITRVTTERMTVKPAKVNVAKVVKASKKKETAAK